MGPLLVGAAGLMWGAWLLRALVPAAASALRACRLGGLRGAAGSCGAVAPAACGDFGVEAVTLARLRLLLVRA